MSYLETTKNVYRDAALTPDVGLCCTTNPIWELPGLKIPKIMQEMNYGCGSTVNARDLTNNPRILYVGAGGGMELLQFAYFSRQKGGVIGVDVVDEMLEASRKNFIEAEAVNPWFKSEFVDLKKGDALNLPVEDNSIDVAAQNCLFNIFKGLFVSFKLFMIFSLLFARETFIKKKKNIVDKYFIIKERLFCQHDLLCLQLHLLPSYQ